MADPTANTNIAPMIEGNAGNIMLFNRLLYLHAALFGAGVEEVASDGSDQDNAYIVGDSPTGNFAGMAEHDIAWYSDGEWRNVSPPTGIVLYDRGTGVYLRFDGSAWLPLRLYPTLNNQVGTTYTLVLADDGAELRMGNAAAIALTVPSHASVAFPLGTEVLITQTGAGQVTVSGAGGVTIQTPETAKTRTQYAQVRLVKVSTNTWSLSGDLEASP